MSCVLLFHSVLACFFIISMCTQSAFSLNYERVMGACVCLSVPTSLLLESDDHLQHHTRKNAHISNHSMDMLMFPCLITGRITKRNKKSLGCKEGPCMCINARYENQQRDSNKHTLCFTPYAHKPTPLCNASAFVM